MLFFQQMATKALITEEQYLATYYEREPELVHGELVERPLPNFPHGSIQLELGSRLRALRHTYPVFTGVEVRNSTRRGLDSHP